MTDSRIVPDEKYPGMWRIRYPDGSLSDMVNLTRAKDAVAAAIEAGIVSAGPKREPLAIDPTAPVVRVELQPAGSGRTAVMYDGEKLSGGRGGVVCRAARALIARGLSPNARLEAMRGEMVCLYGRLGDFAAMTVIEPDKDRVRFVPWVPFPQDARPARAGHSGIDKND